MVAQSLPAKNQNTTFMLVHKEQSKYYQNKNLMKGRVVAVLIIICGIGLRFLIDVLDKPEKIELPIISNVSLKSFLATNNKLFVRQEIIDFYADTVMQMSDSEIRIIPIDKTTYKVRITPSQESDFISIYDNLNLVIRESKLGLKVVNHEMAERQVTVNYDNYLYANFGNDLFGSIEKINDTLRANSIIDNIFLEDLKLYSVNVFSNKDFKLTSSMDSIDLNQNLENDGVRILKAKENTDSTKVIVLSETKFNNGKVVFDTLSYNLKIGNLNKIITNKIVNDKYKIRQVIYK